MSCGFLWEAFPLSACGTEGLDLPLLPCPSLSLYGSPFPKESPGHSLIHSLPPSHTHTTPPPPHSLPTHIHMFTSGLFPVLGGVEHSPHKARCTVHSGCVALWAGSLFLSLLSLPVQADLAPYLTEVKYTLRRSSSLSCCFTCFTKEPKNQSPMIQMP